MEVWCNMNKDGPWTAILVRSYEFLQQNFSRSWEQYKMGFGDPSAEYWLGKDLFRLWIRYILSNGDITRVSDENPFS